MTFNPYKLIEYAISLATILVLFAALAALLNWLFASGFWLTFALVCGLFVVVSAVVAAIMRFAERGKSGERK